MAYCSTCGECHYAGQCPLDDTQGGENKMTNDLLPDEIEVYHDKFGDLLAFKDFDLRVPGTRYVRADLVSTPNKPAEVDLPELLSDVENNTLLRMAEQLFDDLQANKLGGYSGINRPFWILSSFKEVIEKFGHRDVGLKWSKDMLDAAKERHLATGRGGDAITGDTSDGYHTFNELYEHRHILFLSVLTANIDRAWRSKLHDDGTMYDGWFIAGLKTVTGQATYHLPIRMWSLFDAIPELEKAPPFDGHTAEDTLKRLRDDAYFGHRTEQQKTAAPAQIDVRELERAVSEAKIITVYQGSTDNKIHPHDSVVVKSFGQARLILDAARAHLEKSKGGV